MKANWHQSLFVYKRVLVFLLVFLLGATVPLTCSVEGGACFPFHSHAPCIFALLQGHAPVFEGDLDVTIDYGGLVPPVRPYSPQILLLRKEVFFPERLRVVEPQLPNLPLAGFGIPIAVVEIRCLHIPEIAPDGGHGNGICYWGKKWNINL